MMWYRKEKKGKNLKNLINLDFLNSMLALCGHKVIIK